MAKKIVETEVWKTIKFDVEHDSKNKFQISNLGRVRTFNKISDGKILSGSMLNGYRIIRLKLFKKRDDQVLEKLSSMRTRIENYNKRSKKLNKELAELSKRDQRYKQIIIDLDDIEAKRVKLRADYKKMYAKELKNVTMAHHFLIHRMVAKYFVPKGTKVQKFVMHLDHDKLNNVASNLAWGTMKETAQHWTKSDQFKEVIQRRIDGKITGYSKLNRNQVVSIKKLLNKGKTLKFIAQKYNVSDMQIHRIKKGENWGHITV